MSAYASGEGRADGAALHMPEAEAEAVRSAYRAARRIVEYGAGGSTLIAATESQAALLSIESDPGWARRVRRWIAEAGAERDDLVVRHVDIGPVGQWGKPSGPGAFRKFSAYPLSPWTDPSPGECAPDLVLIDGRFRLGCFAATLLNATAPLTVLWDDYADRTAYHAAETLAGPPQMIGRMARWHLEPRALSPSEINRIIPWFVVPG